MCDSGRHIVEDTILMTTQVAQWDAAFFSLLQRHKDVQYEECCRVTIIDDGPPRWKRDYQTWSDMGYKMPCDVEVVDGEAVWPGRIPVSYPDPYVAVERGVGPPPVNDLRNVYYLDGSPVAMTPWPPGAEDVDYLDGRPAS